MKERITDARRVGGTGGWSAGLMEPRRLRNADIWTVWRIASHDVNRWNGIDQMTTDSIPSDCWQKPGSWLILCPIFSDTCILSRLKSLFEIVGLKWTLKDWISYTYMYWCTTQIYTLKCDEVPCAMTYVYSPEGGVLSVNKSFPSITA